MMFEYRVAPCIPLDKFVFGFNCTESDSRYHLIWDVGRQAQLLRRFVPVPICEAYVLEDLVVVGGPFALFIWNTTW
jgi:hypothetical protein